MADVKVFSAAGNLLVQDQNWAAAAAHWENARSIFPDLPLGYWQGINALIRLDQFEAAWDLAAVFDAKLPDNFFAQTYLTNLIARRGKWDEAIKRFEGMQRRFPSRAVQIEESNAYRQSIFNAKGIMEGSRILKSVIQNPERAESEAIPQKFLFVSGMPRAGTTAMGHLLNECRDVGMFTEIYNPYRAYNRSDFSPEILKDKLPKTANPHEIRIVERYDSDSIIGDKRPLFQYSMLQTFEELASYPVTVFHMLRDVLDVCASYLKRAQDPKDNWDRLRGLSQCIHELNVMHRLIQQMNDGFELRDNHKVVYVDYMRMFKDEAYAANVLEQSGARFYPEKLKEFQQKSGARKKSEIKDRDILCTALHDQLDFAAVGAVQEITGISLLEGLTRGP